MLSRFSSFSRFSRSLRLGFSLRLLSTFSSPLTWYTSSGLFSLKTRKTGFYCVKKFSYLSWFSDVWCIDYFKRIKVTTFHQVSYK